MFEATLSEDFWGDEDFTCKICHRTFVTRRGASVHAESEHKVRSILIKDRAKVRVEVEPEEECEVIEDIDANMRSQGEYVEFVEEERAEEIKNEEVKMEETFHVNTNEKVGSQTEMDTSDSEVKDEGIEQNMEVKDVKGEGSEEKSGEYIEEDDTEFKPRIESIGEDCETCSEANAENEEEEGYEEREPEEDSDSEDSMTPEVYERQAEMEALYRDQLGIVIEESDDEDEREVGFISTYIFPPSIYCGSFRWKLFTICISTLNAFLRRSCS